MKELHCDICGEEAPPLQEANRTGWYLSSRENVAGIPWDLFCPDCVAKIPSINIKYKNI